jgi:hypothetical protein
MVVRNYRATAQRLHADHEAWSYLLFGPMFMVGVAVLVASVRAYFPGEATNTYSLYAAFGVSLTFLVGYVRAVWSGSGSFDRACQRRGGDIGDDYGRKVELSEGLVARARAS